MKKELKIRFKANRPASALIMTIVLTVLLAIVAVMFVAVARMDRASTSNIADNKTLDLAAKSIVEIINKELIDDTPGVPGQEYYDYPDANNPWLASLEPYQPNPSDPNYRWRQISDVTGHLKIHNFPVSDVNVKPIGLSTYDVVREYPIFKIDANGIFLKPNGSPATNGVSADADGDGIADSKWIEVNDLNWSMRSSKGRRIYAAVRVIDNGGMININTAHTFNPASTSDVNINGASQMQINLKGLLKTGDSITTLHNNRCVNDSKFWPNYEKNVIWDYNNVPGGNYLPFDISDELELKYRYCIDSKFKSRFEYRLPQTTDAYGAPGGLYDTIGSWDLDKWQRRITEPNYPDADRRHMLTTYNFDRVVDPCGVRMINLNTAGVKDVNSAIRRGLYDAGMNHSDANKVAAQVAVNVIDYRDTDPNVAVLKVDGVDYYGFERPCVYISELAYRQVTDSNIPVTYKSYAIELYKPYTDDIGPNSTWQVHISSPSTTVSIDNWTGSKQYYVIKWETAPQAALDVNTSDANTQDETFADVLAAGSTISLTRRIGSDDIVVDSVVVPVDWSSATDGDYSVQRDITLNKCIRRLWPSTDSNSVTLGRFNTYTTAADANMIQAHPADANFTNVGQIGILFRKPAYYNPAIGDSNAGKIGYSNADKIESAVRLNLADADYQQIFKYLTVMDPRNHISNAGETRIKGRININTAPAFVIAQLPWVSYRPTDYNDPNIAKAIVAYRDKMQITGGPNYRSRSDANGFGSIGQLCNVIGGGTDFRIDYYARDYAAGIPVDQSSFPDLSYSDGAANDFEERDLIFARISDLVTVRSDVFTAYILVRVGVDGPQKRYMVIFDRSGVKPPITNPNNRKVKIIAFHSVPEAR